jgi:hypothetical protein
MYAELLTGIILCVVIFCFIIVIGGELFAIMADEQLRLLRLIVHYAPFPAAERTADGPEPVSRYMSWALAENRGPDSGCVRVRHEGRIRFGKDGRWMPMGGEAFFALAVPAFVWRSTILYAPGIWLESFDYYVDRIAGMNLNLFSVFPLNNGQSDALKGRSLFRYLACTPLFPLVHTTSSFIRWENIDETMAKAVISDNGQSAEAVVRFDSRGRIGSIEACGRTDPDTSIPLPGHFLSRFSSYREMAGFRIPRQIVSEIILPEGGHVCAEYTITAVEPETPVSRAGRFSS